MPNKCVSPYPENKTSKMCCQNICQEAVKFIIINDQVFSVGRLLQFICNFEDA